MTVWDPTRIVPLMDMLIKAKAGPDDPDDNGNTPLAYAISHHLKDAALLLLEADASTDNFRNPLQKSAVEGCKESG